MSSVDGKIGQLLCVLIRGSFFVVLGINEFLDVVFSQIVNAFFLLFSWILLDQFIGRRISEMFMS